MSNLSTQTVLRENSSTQNSSQAFTSCADHIIGGRAVNHQRQRRLRYHGRSRCSNEKTKTQLIQNKYRHSALRLWDSSMLERNNFFLTLSNFSLTRGLLKKCDYDISKGIIKATQWIWNKQKKKLIYKAKWRCNKLDCTSGFICILKELS